MKKISLVLFATALLALGGLWTYETLQDCFFESSIQVATWPKKEYGKLDCIYSVEEAREIFKQPFTYLGKGKNFFVFESADGKYVLKFLNCKNANASGIEDIFESCKLAACHAPRVTGVVYCHLNRSCDINSNVELKDKLGLSHTVFLDSVPFVLQKKAQLFFPTLQKLLDAKNYVKLQERLNILFDFFIVQAIVEIHDTDPEMFVRGNIGFLEFPAEIVQHRDKISVADYQPMQVAVGTLVEKKDALTYQHLKDQIARLDPVIKWLEEKDPQQAQYFKDKIANKISKWQSLKGGPLSESTPTATPR